MRISRSPLQLSLLLSSPHHPKLQSFTLSIALLLAPSIAFQMPAIENPTVQVAQQNTSEIDAVIADCTA